MSWLKSEGGGVMSRGLCPTFGKLMYALVVIQLRIVERVALGIIRRALHTYCA